VNVLLATTDTEHVFHRSIREWLGAHRGEEWATCPMTENGFVRVSSQPTYRGGTKTPAESIEMLRAMKSARVMRHTFWSDEISLTDASAVNSARLTGHSQIADVYLAALAFRKQGRLVTFDAAVAWHAVIGATAELIEIPPV
jgi:toxin-antitoxin system PIN domain toxin